MNQTQLHEAVPPALPRVVSDKAIEGKDSFLFLGGADANDLEAHLTGARGVERGAHTIWSENVRARRALGDNLHGVIVPEAHVVYSDKLPGWFRVGEDRPVCVLARRLASHFTYLLDTLRESRRKGIEVYTGNDSHWTEPAAREGWIAVRPKLGLRTDFTSGYPADKDREARDLLVSGASEGQERDLRTWAAINARIVLHTRILNKGLVCLFHNEKADAGRLLVFGTSFSVRLIPCYVEDFREVLFVYGTSIDQGIVKLFRPDKIFMEMPERFLHFPAPDGAAPTTLIGTVARASLLDDNSACFTHAADTQALSDPAKEVLELFREVDNRLTALLSGRSMTGSRTGRHTLMLDTLFNVAPMLRAEPGLLPIFFGHYRSVPALYNAFKAVDEGHIDERCLELLPNSEMATLIRIRILVRQGRTSEAAALTTTVMDRFGLSQESKYFAKLLL